ncbi:hypothetical protein RHECNPAF_28004 [Rhizobium etli CNPAF512]|nr:hypothetical protein RHECNPAF_28004 [Rhizobium etli CNPAF512]
MPSSRRSSSLRGHRRLEISPTPMRDDFPRECSAQTPRPSRTCDRARRSVERGACGMPQDGKYCLR